MVDTSVIVLQTPFAWSALQDRQHMGLLSAVLDHDRVLYIMTLGVVQGHRHRGLASTLIAIACQQAYETRWVCRGAQASCWFGRSQLLFALCWLCHCIGNVL